MATSNSNAIYTAQELKNYGHFTFNTSNISHGAYIPNYNICPTKSKMIAAMQDSGYTLSISSSYGNNQLVPYNGWSLIKNIGKLTINISCSSDLISSLTTSSFGNVRYSTTTFNYDSLSQYTNNTLAFGVTPNTISSSNITQSGSLYKVTFTLDKSQHSEWPCGTYLCFITYACVTSSYPVKALILYGHYSTSEAATLNSGTDVTSVNAWTIVEKDSTWLSA